MRGFCNFVAVAAVNALLGGAATPADAHGGGLDAQGATTIARVEGRFATARRRAQRALPRPAWARLATAGTCTETVRDRLRVRAFSCLSALLLTAQAAPEAVLGDIEVRLFYKETGRLSEDILSLKRKFVFHNSIISEGDAVDQVGAARHWVREKSCGR